MLRSGSGSRSGTRSYLNFSSCKHAQWVNNLRSTKLMSISYHQLSLSLSFQVPASPSITKSKARQNPHLEHVVELDHFLRKLLQHDQFSFLQQLGLVLIELKLQMFIKRSLRTSGGTSLTLTTRECSSSVDLKKDIKVLYLHNDGRWSGGLRSGAHLKYGGIIMRCALSNSLCSSIMTIREEEAKVATADYTD